MNAPRTRGGHRADAVAGAQLAVPDDGPAWGQSVRMPVSVDLPSRVGPRKQGQSEPVLEGRGLGRQGNWKAGELEGRGSRRLTMVSSANWRISSGGYFARRLAGGSLGVGHVLRARRWARRARVRTALVRDSSRRWVRIASGCDAAQRSGSISSKFGASACRRSRRSRT